MYIEKGSTIGIYSPSSPVTYSSPKRTKRAEIFVKEQGISIKEGKLYGKNDFYRSGSVKERADELNELIHDPSVTCIMSAIGGMNSNSLLPYIDYEYIRKNPKIFIGYSDATAVLMAIFEKCSIPVFYGPAFVATFGEYPPYNKMSWDYMMSVLSKDRKFPIEYTAPPYWSEEFIDWETQDRAKSRNKNEWITINKGLVTGRLIIGNLDTIYGIWGSPYMPKILQGDILFIEDSLKSINEIERGFSFLKCNGIFDKISGLILGKYEGFDSKGSNRKPYEVLTEILQEKNIPILAEVDCSHTHPMFTLPIGGNVTLDATNKKIILNNIRHG